MTAEEARRLDHFFCESCSSEDQKKLQNSHSNSRHSDTKVFPLIAAGKCYIADFDSAQSCVSYSFRY